MEGGERGGDGMCEPVQAMIDIDGLCDIIGSSLGGSAEIGRREPHYSLPNQVKSHLVVNVQWSDDITQRCFEKLHGAVPVCAMTSMRLTRQWGRFATQSIAMYITTTTSLASKTMESPGGV